MPRSRALIRYWGIVPIALAIALFALRALLATTPLDNLAPVTADPRDPPGTHVREGWLYIARGGPVIVGFDSPGTARLVVGDPQLMRNGAPAGKALVGKGLVGFKGRDSGRVVLPPGPIAIRFSAPDGARLVWSPVGRRGEPEYVPASSLSRSRTFAGSAGAAPLDGVIGLALLLVIVGSALMLARHRLRAVSRQTWLAIGGIFVLGCVVRWLGLSAFGQTWDEDVIWSAGRNYVTNVLSLDFSDASWIWNYEHPPVMKYLEGIGAQFADGFGPARAMSAMWTALGCALLVPIGARLYSFRVGVLAALIATLLPPLVAHGQIVGHESPTVLWWMLGILLALGVHDGDPTPRQRILRLVAVGVVIGIAVASRFVNGLLGVVCLGIVIERSPQRVRTLVESFVMPVVAYATLYLIWPRMWRHPITALTTAFDKLKHTHATEPFLGAFTERPGPHYFFAYLGATLPVVILAGVLAWVARSWLDRTRSTIILVGWFVIPLAVIASPVRQDGVRYVMPCVLALAMMSAAGWEWVASRIRHKHAFATLAGALALYLGITLARIRPYYLDYYGEHVGGPGTVAENKWFETAWWGEGVDRAVDYVNAHAAPNARVYRDCILPSHLAWFREDLWTPMVKAPEQATWIVTYAPQTRTCKLPPDARRVFSIDAQGAVLAEVWQRP